jgi:hypothetical protein
VRITTRAMFDMATGKCLSRTWYEYGGPVELAKGASAQQTQLANTQQSFYNTVLQNYNTQFANQSSILSSLTSGWNQIFNAGIGQYGYTPAEDTALRTQASEGTATTYNQALTALNEQLGARGGGNTPGVTSGGDAQLQAEIAKAGAADIANKQLGITESGYNIGRQNYLTAASSLAGVAGQENPLSYGGLGVSAGQSAFGSATQVNKENQAASPWNVIAPILGGAAGSFLGPIGTSLGSSLGSAISGATTGSNSSGGGGLEDIGIFGGTG